MKKMLKQTAESDLLHSRSEALKNAQDRGSLSPLGKVIGMDAFTWNNPQIDDLLRSLSAMRAPVIWMCHSSQMKEVINHHKNEWAMFKSIVIYDKSSFYEFSDWTKYPFDLMAIEGVESAAQTIQGLREDSAVLMFTGLPNNWSNNLEVFKAQLAEL